MPRFARTLATIAAAALSIALVPLTAAPASAAPSDCAAGYGCSWSEANYKGKSGMFSGGRMHFFAFVEDYSKYWYPLPTIHLNDKQSSVFNNGTQGLNVTFYSDAYYRGKTVTVAPRNGIANLTTRKMNDQISSACFAGNCVR